MKKAQLLFMNDTEKNQATLATIATLQRIYEDDSNAILAADLTGKHKGNSPAVFVELIAELLRLSK